MCILERRLQSNIQKNKINDDNKKINAVDFKTEIKCPQMESNQDTKIIMCDIGETY